MTNYSNYLYIAIRAAIDAGKSIMDIYTDPEMDFEIEIKADNSPLTKADKASNSFITRALSVTPFPILSEEGKEIPFKERSKWRTFWLIDPLDGTKEFIKRNGEFTVNIALVENGVPVLGVIYVPVRKELYFAADSIGAYKYTGIDIDNQPSMEEMKKGATKLPISLAHQGMVVVASRSHQSEATTEYINNLRKQVFILVLPQRWSGIRPLGTLSPEPRDAIFIISTRKRRCDIIRRICIILGSSSNSLLDCSFYSIFWS